MFAARRAVRLRNNQVEATVRQVVLGRLLTEFFALFAPFALHHHRQPVNDDIQKATDDKAERKYNGDEKRCGFAKQLKHRVSPSGCGSA